MDIFLAGRDDDEDFCLEAASFVLVEFANERTIDIVFIEVLVIIELAAGDVADGTPVVELHGLGPVIMDIRRLGADRPENEPEVFIGAVVPEPGDGKHLRVFVQVLVAFTSDTDDELYLTLEVLEQGVVNVPTVLHELTHIVDFKLKHDGLMKDEEWAKLNPEGFAYSESYADNMAGKKNSENCYCTDHYVPHNTNCSSEDIWFYYSYSKVNAYEDRATTLENLIIYKMWNYKVAPDLYKSPHMKAKAEFFLKLVEKDFKMTDSDKEAWKKAFKAIS